MRTKALAMLTDLDSLVRQDTKRAREVRAGDDEVDDLNRQIFREFSAAVRKNPDHVECLLSYLSVAALERIADYATNMRRTSLPDGGRDCAAQADAPGRVT